MYTEILSSTMNAHSQNVFFCLQAVTQPQVWVLDVLPSPKEYAKHFYCFGKKISKRNMAVLQIHCRLTQLKL